MSRVLLLMILINDSTIVGRRKSPVKQFGKAPQFPVWFERFEQRLGHAEDY